MPNHRMDRTEEDIRRELTAILSRVKDPRVTGSLVSILRVDVTRDLSYATVHITSMDGMESAKQAVTGLKSAAGYMRRELGNALSLRHTPELRFIADDSIEYSARIAEKLQQIHKEEKPNDEDHF